MPVHAFNTLSGESIITVKHNILSKGVGLKTVGLFPLICKRYILGHQNAIKEALLMSAGF